MIENQGIELMKQILWLTGTVHQELTSYAPQTQGLVQKINRAFTFAFAMYCSSKQSDWDNCIQMCVFAINASVQDTTKFIPFYSMYGSQATLRTEIALTNFGNGNTKEIDLDGYTVKSNEL